MWFFEMFRMLQPYGRIPLAPDYNPIKDSFSGLKAWIRRHKALVEGFESGFPAFIHMAVQKYKAGDNAEAHFRNSFINCT